MSFGDEQHEPSERVERRAPTVEPDVLELDAVCSALIDELVEKRQARTGESAEAARRAVREEVVRDGILVARRREGLAA